MKLAAILQLLLPVNFAGYRLLFYFLQKSAATAMTTLLALLCLPNRQKMLLEKVCPPLFTGAVPALGKGDAIQFIAIKSILSIYDLIAAPWRLPPLIISTQHGQPQHKKLYFFFLPNTGQPPETSVISFSFLDKNVILLLNCLPDY